MPLRSWLIGSAPECDLRVESPTVSAQHCRLTACGDGFLLEDLASSNGTFVAGVRIVQPQVVRRGDSVTLGRAVPLPWPAEGPSITVGRLPDNDLVIALETVSGRHARLERLRTHVLLTDLGSTNGTAVNDPLNKITQARLQPSDVVFLGTHRVSAQDLLAALPDLPQQATVLEGSLRPEMSRGENPAVNVEHDPAPAQSAIRGFPTSIRSPGAWLAGTTLSVVCVAVILVAASFLRPTQAKTIPSGPPVGAIYEVQQPTTPTADIVAETGEPAAKANKHLTSDSSSTAVANKDQPVVVALGFGVDSRIVIGTEASPGNWRALGNGWPCAPNLVVLPRLLIERFTKRFSELEQGRATLLACCPGHHPVPVLPQTSSPQPAYAFTVVTIETPLPQWCTVAPDATATTHVTAQELHTLVSEMRGASAEQLASQIVPLTVQRIERSATGLPTLLHCQYGTTAGTLIGAPVFNANEQVVGCIRTADPERKEVEVVPISELRSLLSIQP